MNMVCTSFIHYRFWKAHQGISNEIDCIVVGVSHNEQPYTVKCK